jgi:phosphonate transport system permease protein
LAKTLTSNTTLLGLGEQPLPEWRRFKFPQSLYKYIVIGLGVWATAWSFDYLNIDLTRLPGIFGRIGEVLTQRYFPPDIEHILQAEYLAAVVDTFQMSYVATVLGLLMAMPLAWFASFNMTPSRRFVYPLARLAVMSCRSVHEMIWTIVIVAIVGYGMLPGTLAMTLFCVGFSGKLLAEAVEAIRPGPVEAIRSAGANQVQVFIYAVLPQVRVAWTGIAIYTWDMVFRAATVVGFFGAGGMGHFLRESVQRVESRQVAAIILSIIVIVLATEILSAMVRQRIAKAIC